MVQAGETRVLLGLGANAGDRVAALRRAVRRLESMVEPERVSSVYLTEPVGYADQPDFLNLVVLGRTRLTPDELLDGIHRIELDLGRVPSFPNGPRIIDIDILAYGTLVHEGPDLRIPHPRMSGRAFVLLPISEVAPDWTHPETGLTAAEMLSASGGVERVELWGALRA